MLVFCLVSSKFLCISEGIRRTNKKNAPAALPQETWRFPAVLLLQCGENILSNKDMRRSPSTCAPHFCWYNLRFTQSLGETRSHLDDQPAQVVKNQWCPFCFLAFFPLLNGYFHHLIKKQHQSYPQTCYFMMHLECHVFDVKEIIPGNPKKVSKWQSMDSTNAMGTQKKSFVFRGYFTHIIGDV